MTAWGFPVRAWRSFRDVYKRQLEFYLRLMVQAREAIAAGTFGSFKDSFIARYKANDIL